MNTTLESKEDEDVSKRGESDTTQISSSSKPDESIDQTKESDITADTSRSADVEETRDTTHDDSLESIDITQSEPTAKSSSDQYTESFTHPTTTNTMSPDHSASRDTTHDNDTYQSDTFTKDTTETFSESKTSEFKTSSEPTKTESTTEPTKTESTTYNYDSATFDSSQDQTRTGDNTTTGEKSVTFVDSKESSDENLRPKSSLQRRRDSLETEDIDSPRNMNTDLDKIQF